MLSIIELIYVILLFGLSNCIRFISIERKSTEYLTNDNQSGDFRLLGVTDLTCMVALMPQVPINNSLRLPL